MSYPRRQSMTHAGEPLLLCRSTIEAAVRFDAWLDASGMPAAAVLASPLCAVPLPIYTNFAGRRRWEGTRAEIMWHPLMWLPPRLAGRYDLRDSTSGTIDVEGDDVYAIRVAFELTASGLYDPETGTWVDILATVGLDIDNDVDLARVQEWLDGAPDELLDDIDLSHYLTIDPPTWAVEAALGMREDLERASWALTADELLGACEDALDPAQEMDATELRATTKALAGIADALLRRADRAETGLFDDVATRVDPATHTPDPGELTELVSEMCDLLLDIREANWMHLELLSAGAEA